MKTYKIVRFKQGSDNITNEVIKTNLTLKDAQEHCSRENTHEKDIDGNVLWFDGYEEE